MKLSKQDIQTLEALSVMFEANKDLDNQLYHMFNESYYYEHFEPKYSEAYGYYTNSFFQIACKETQDFDSFYDSFNSPGGDDGTRPVVWDNGYPPDRMVEIMVYGTTTVKEKIKDIQKLYKQCIKIRKKFQKEKK